MNNQDNYSATEHANDTVAHYAVGEATPSDLIDVIHDLVQALTRITASYYAMVNYPNSKEH